MFDKRQSPRIRPKILIDHRIPRPGRKNPIQVPTTETLFEAIFTPMIQLENRLWASAMHSASEAGMEFTVPCSHNLRDLIRAGTGVMRREKRVSESDLELADVNLGKLVEEMTRVTRGFGKDAVSGGKIKIRETALAEAKELCPLWPFG